MNKKTELEIPQQEKKILLHCCCAPCSGSILKRLLEQGFEPVVYFYNPNIYPREEYELRKAEVIRYAEKMKVPFVDADYDPDRWAKAIRGRERDPERGERCSLCFEMRLGKAASYAAQKDFKVFTTSLGIARWKDFEQVVRAGKRSARLFPGLVFWDFNWRKNGGSEQMISISKQENFYRQQYCGCFYSFQNSRAKKKNKS